MIRESDKVLFSIIIPVYNRADFIKSTIKSVLAQTYKNFELIIVNDGSTDNSSKVINSIVDNRIKYFEKNNEERAIARNFGIAKANGEYVTFLDSDDKLYPYFLAEAIKLLDSHDKPDWFHLAYEVKNENGTVLRKENKRRGNINETLVTGNHLSCIGVFVRSNIIQKFKFNEDRDLIGSEDYLLWMELAATFPLHYSNRISAYMIQHSARSVLNFNSDKLITRIDRLKQYLFAQANCLEVFKKHKNKISAFLDIYLALHLLPHRKKAMKYFLRSLKQYPNMIFKKRFYGFLKSFLYA